MGTLCVIGGGPAGSTFAARMAQLGHDVVLVERATFPRRQLGESLSPGVLPLLGMTGARAAVEAAGFRRVRTVRVLWQSGEEVRDDPREQGTIVGRGEFDWLLLRQTLALGVRVLQPATVRACRYDGGRWRVEAGTRGGTVHVEADFLADARGRAGGGGRTRRWTGARTLALYAYWRGAALPGEPRIEAGSEAWYWGVPLPDGTYNTLAFVASTTFNLNNCFIGDLILQGNCVRNFYVAGGAIFNIQCPPPRSENPFNGSVHFDKKVYLLRRSGRLLRGAQPYRNMRAHIPVQLAQVHKNVLDSRLTLG